MAFTVQEITLDKETPFLLPPMGQRNKGAKATGPKPHFPTVNLDF